MRHDVDPAQVAVDAVGEGDVDDAVLTGKGNGGFRTFTGKREEPLTRATRQQNSKCIFHIRALPSSAEAKAGDIGHWMLKRGDLASLLFVDDESEQSATGGKDAIDHG